MTQQTLSDDDTSGRGIYTVIDEELPGAWRNRMDRIWHNTETDELVVIRPGTMAQIGEGDGYQVSIHRKGGVDTVLDNISLERANETAARYIREGTYPAESWLSEEQGDTDRR